MPASSTSAGATPANANAKAAAAASPVSPSSRPKRRATNAHVFRYLHHGNPERLQDRDLKRALEASLEDCSSDLWPAEDSASCSSSDQSNAASASITSNISDAQAARNRYNQLPSSSSSSSALRSRRSSHQSNGTAGRRDRRLDNPFECNCHARQSNSNSQSTTSASARPPASNSSSSSNQLISCPIHGQKRVKVHKRFKPVVKKNVYYEADFFHEGIMEYIEYELMRIDEMTLVRGNVVSRSPEKVSPSDEE